MNIIIITGASSGIGQEFALQLDTAFSNIDEIWLIARRKERMEEVAKVMEHKTRIITMDVTNKESFFELSDLLKVHDVKIRMLINCAGYGIMGEFFKQKLSDQTGMIRVNCEALTSLTHLCIPYMKRNSRIIQMASSAAFLPQANFAVYAASKSYVLSFSRALAEELRPKGIYVTAVCPGPVETEFFDIAERTGSTLAFKKKMMVTSERVVEDAIKDSYNKKTVSVCSGMIKFFRVIAKVLPHDLLLAVVHLAK